jgi:hypothetical protein
MKLERIFVLRWVARGFGLAGFLGVLFWAVMDQFPYDGLIEPSATRAWLAAISLIVGLQPDLLVAFDPYLSCCCSCAGKNPLPLNSRRLWAGTLAGVVAGSLSILVSSSLSAPRLGTGEAWPWALVASLSSLSAFLAMFESFRPLRLRGTPSAPEASEFDYMLLNGEGDTPQKPSSGPHGSILCWINAVVLSLMFVFVAFLTFSAVQTAYGCLTYPLRGTFAKITLNDGREQNILYSCEGPDRSPRPTVLLASDISHGMADFWPLQRYSDTLCDGSDPSLRSFTRPKTNFFEILRLPPS